MVRALVRDWTPRVGLIGLLSGLLLGGIVYWRTGAPRRAAALAGAVVVMMLGMWVKRERARMRALEESVHTLREQVRHLQPADDAAPQREAPLTATPARSATRMDEPRERVIDALTDAAMTELSVWKRLWVWLVSGNTAVRVGVVVLFFGMAFLISYAYESVRVLPIGARLVGVALAAVFLLAIGWWLRAKRPAYGEALQGGGVGLLYLAVFGAAYGFNLLQGNAAFVLLVAVVALAGLPCRQAERPMDRDTRHSRRLSGSGAADEWRREPRNAVRLLPGAESGYLRHRVSQVVAVAERVGAIVHLRRRIGVGRSLLPAANISAVPSRF